MENFKDLSKRVGKIKNISKEDNEAFTKIVFSVERFARNLSKLSSEDPQVRKLLIHSERRLRRSFKFAFQALLIKYK